MNGMDWIVLVGVVGVFGYWQIREKQEQVDRGRGGHSERTARMIRWLMPVVGLGIVVQAVGWGRFDMSLPEAVAEVVMIGGLAVFLGGAVVSVWAREVLGGNWAHAAEYQVREGQELVQSGPYRWVRHPIYTALGLMLLGAELVFGSWLALLAAPLFLFFDWQAGREERLLARHFGGAWQTYARRTGRLWPRVR